MEARTPAETSAAQAGAQARKPLWRRVLRKVGWVVLGLVVLVALLIAFVHTSWGKDMVRARVEKALQKRVTGKLSIGALDYGFMFSDVELENVEIKDATGKPAIALGRLYVDLDRGSLLDGAPILDRVVLDGVNVSILENADGTSSLTGLFVPSERKGRRITIGAIEVSRVNVRIEKPDGAVTEIADAGLIGSASINSVDRIYGAKLTELGAGVTIRKADGTAFVLPRTTTSLEAAVTATSADVSVGGFKTEASLTRPDKGTQALTLSLGATHISRQDKRVQASVGGLRAGPLTVGKLTAEGEVVDKKMRGSQTVAVEGLRVAHEELAALLGRPVLVSDIGVDLRIEGPAEKLGINGTIATDGGNLGITGAVNAANFDQPGYQVSIKGTDLKTASIIATPEGEERPSLESSFELAVQGSGIPRRPGSTARVELSTGPSRLTAKGKSGDVETVRLVAVADGPALKLEDLTIEALGLKIAASGSLSAGRSIQAKVSIDGNARTALADLRALGIKPSRPIPIPLPGKLDLDVTATGHLDGSIGIDIAPTSIPIAGGSIRLGARAELEKVDGKRSLSRADADIVLSRVRIEKLARIAGRKTSLAGSLSGTLAVRQRGALRDIDYDVRANLAEPGVTVTARGSLGARSAVVNADVFARDLGETVATIEGSIPLRRRGGKLGINPGGKLDLDIAVARRSIDEVKTLVPERIAAKLDERAKSGELQARIKLGGTPSAPRGTIALAGRAELVKLPGQTVNLELDATLSPTSAGGVAIAPKTVVVVDGVEGPVATIGGRVTVGSLFRNGKLDREGLRRSAKLGLIIEVPERSLASLAPLRPKLSSLPGDASLRITTAGSPKNPAFTVTGDWSGYATASGQEGAVHLEAAGTPTAITASIALGASQQVKLSAVVDRQPDQMIVGIRANAEKTRLAELLPAMVAEKDVDIDFGEIEWKMNGEIGLSKASGSLAVESVDLNGFLDVAGSTIAVPKSSRRYTDVGLRIEGDGDIVRLARLSATESDEQKENRTIALSAEASIGKGRPTSATARIVASDWLVFGGSMGPTDAPRATLSANIDVVADLEGDIPVIDATVNALDFSEPDRFLRDHGLVDVSPAGDIMFLGETDVPVGKLGPRRDPAPAAEPRKRTPMRVRLAIPRPIHLQKTPLDVNVSGSLDVEITEDAVIPVGKLEVHRGKVLLFGHQHEYESGEIAFDRDNPKGKLSLTFARALAPATLRQLSRASGGHAVKITIAGNVSERQITLSGAGNAGMLEVMSAHNAGRAYYHSEPDLPASSSVQAPQLLQPMVLTFLATNLPHMLVLDRFSAWSDPYDSRDAYGRVEHFVGERNTSKRSRVRVVSRPRAVGRSGTEVQLDRLIVNSASMAVGAGVRAGSRLGGGLALFFEWTSSD